MKPDKESSLGSKEKYKRKGQVKKGQVKIELNNIEYGEFMLCTKL